MGLKDTLRKAAGLLVELPPEEPATTAASDIAAGSSAADALFAEPEGGKKPAKTVEQIVRDTRGPNLDQITVPAAAGTPPTTSDGTLDFPAIYRSAGLPPAGFGAEQTLDLIASLPAELPLETKRQTVRVSLDALGKTVGATPETIVADASRKLAALAAYAEAVAKQTTEFVGTAEAEIAALQAQIEEKRKQIQTHKRQQEDVAHACDAESDRLDDVLEFFSLDVGPSKYAALK